LINFDRTTELELIYLIIDQPRGFSLLKSNEIVHFIASQLKKMINPKNKGAVLSQGILTTDIINLVVDEKLLMYILIKLAIKDQKMLFDEIDQCLELLKQLLLSNKTYLSKYTKSALATIIQDDDRGREAYEIINSV